MNELLEILDYHNIRPFKRQRSTIENNKESIKTLINMGLLAGDYSRAYITDLGDDTLEVYIKMKSI